MVCIYACYPAGNFRGNQLLDGSISLSPLYSNLTIDLHVRIATSLHQSFLWLHPIQVQFTIFRVPTDMLLLKSFKKYPDRSMVQTHKGNSHLHSLSLRIWVYHPNTRIYVRLLGPCFKTGRIKPLSQHPKLKPVSRMPRQTSHTSDVNELSSRMSRRESGHCASRCRFTSI